MLNTSLNTVVDLSHPWWPSLAADQLLVERVQEKNGAPQHDVEHHLRSAVLAHAREEGESSEQLRHLGCQRGAERRERGVHYPTRHC